MARALGGEILNFSCWPGGETDAASMASSAAEVTRIDSGGLLPGHWLPVKARRQAKEAVREVDLLVVHSFYQAHVAWTRRVAHDQSIPYWLVPNGVLDPEVMTKNQWAKRLWIRLFGRAVLRDAAAIICATRREAEKVQQHYGVENTVVVHWPCDLQDLTKRSEARKALRGRYGWDADTRILFFMGRLHEGKRPTETVEAFRAAACERTVLILAGPDDGAAGEAARQAAEGSDRIVFTGLVQGEQKEELLLAADGFISLSQKENFGYTTAESLAAGLPVILSPGHDLAPELKAVDCGWLLASFEPQEAVAAIRAFDQAPAEDLADRGARGRAWAERELSFEAFQHRLSDLVEETVL